MRKKLMALLLTGAMILTAAACGGNGGGTGGPGGLPGGGNGGKITAVELTATAEGTPSLGEDGYTMSGPIRCSVGEYDRFTDFSVNLFRESMTAGENTTTSPLSALLALAMTGRGSEGETREELEAAMGGKMDELCSLLNLLQKQLQEREGVDLTIANSIWLRDDADRLTVKDQFLVDAREYFDARIYKAAFDETTVKDINNWCSKATDGMIDQLVKTIDPSEVMHLINAICFDATWEIPYDSYEVSTQDFHTEDGKVQKADLMYSTEMTYISDENATGFIKPYQGGYSFAAILPKEGISVADYIASMTGYSFRNLMAGASEEPVAAALPKFSGEYSVDLIPALKALGIRQLFDADAAELGDMATSANGNIFISKVFQKAFIEVDTEGTRAAAATDIAAEDGAMMVMKEVRLDRPFLYAIIDDETGVPVFMGTVMETE